MRSMSSSHDRHDRWFLRLHVVLCVRIFLPYNISAIIALKNYVKMIEIMRHSLMDQLYHILRKCQMSPFSLFPKETQFLGSLYLPILIVSSDRLSPMYPLMPEMCVSQREYRVFPDVKIHTDHLFSS